MGRAQCPNREPIGGPKGPYRRGAKRLAGTGPKEGYTESGDVGYGGPHSLRPLVLCIPLCVAEFFVQEFLSAEGFLSFRSRTTCLLREVSLGTGHGMR